MRPRNALIEPTNDQLTLLDQKRLDEAVVFINTQLNKAANSLIEIGNYLLANFFNGDQRKVQDHTADKSISLRRLAAHKDLDLSYAHLSNAIRLAIQERELTGVESEYVTQSHKLLLIKIEDNQEKRKYIERIIANRLSTRALRELLISAGHLQPRGRPLLNGERSSGVQTEHLDVILKPLDMLAQNSLECFDLNAFTADEARLTLSKAQQVQQKLAALITKLQELIN